MRLRNKKTGEILETVRSAMVNKDKFRIYDDLTDKYYTYNSLAELNEEWEDYEEPKDYWWISPVDTDVVHCVEDAKDEMDQYNKAIGNYFDTREEAEKAVEKLKAWKRIKDKGFEFDGWKYYDEDYIKFKVKNRDLRDVEKDLDLLFGGEE